MRQRRRSPGFKASKLTRPNRQLGKLRCSTPNPAILAALQAKGFPEDLSIGRGRRGIFCNVTHTIGNWRAVGAL
jgi:hypothetical protein